MFEAYAEVFKWIGVLATLTVFESKLFGKK